MRHGKKLVSVPESEYQALLGLLTGNNPIKKEKFLTDKKITETLNKPDLTQLEKGVKYQALSKKRKQLNKKIQDKPFRVLIEQGKNSVLPTTGVAPAAKTEQQVQEFQQQPPQQEQQEEEPPEPEVEGEDKAKRATSNIIIKYHASIAKKFARKLNALVEANREELGINEEGKIYLNMSRKAYNLEEKSDNKNILNFLLGNTDSVTEKKSTSLLIKRLQKIYDIKALMEQSQEWTGKRKRYVFSLTAKNAIKTSKTRGLTRGFKPVLWNKIPV
jgi:hypothetical protein